MADGRMRWAGVESRVVPIISVSREQLSHKPQYVYGYVPDEYECVGAGPG